MQAATQDYNKILEDLRVQYLSLMEINEQNKWELYSDKDGYIVYTKVNPENGIRINRTSTIIPASVEEILTLISDIKRRGEYDENFDSGAIIEQVDPNTQVLYAKVKPPVMMMSPRDTVLLTRVIRNKDGSALTLGKSIEYVKCPPVPKVERAEMYISGWHLTPMDNGTRVVVLANLNPKGNIPAAVVNQAAKLQYEMVKKVVHCLTKNKK